MADPWDNIPVVAAPRTRQPQGPAYGVVASSYTNETEDELRAQGYEKDPATGVWAKVVGTAPSPGSDAPQGAAPWDSIPVLTDSQTRAAEQAVTTNGAYDAGSSVYQGLLAGFADELAGKSAGLGQLGRNAIRRVQGQPIEINSADLSDAVTNEWRQQERQFAQSNPVQNIGGQVAGGLLTGGGAIGTGIRGAALTGAAYGATSGAGNAEGGVVERLPGAAVGGVVGGALGGAVQGAGQVASPYISRIAGITGVGTRPFREAAGNVFGQRAAPEVVAARRLSDQLGRSGVTPEAASADILRFRGAGLEPSIIDVGGQNLRATVRASASGEGPGRDLATQYAEGVRSSVGPRTIERARRLTTDNRDAIQVARDLTSARRAEARDLYGDAYNQEITVPIEIIGALRGPEGAAAIAEARRIAALERDADALRALDDLATADFDQATTATGKALDYVRQAYADMAQGAEGNLGAALTGRVNEIEAGLNLIPELRTARNAYRSASEQIDAVGGVPNGLGRQQLGRPDRAPQNALTTDASRYGEYVGGLSEPAQAANQVYQRDQIVRSLGQAREGAVGPLNALSAGSNLPAGPNAPIVARNLEATFPGQGQQFQQDIRLAREQVTGANFIDPNSGSQSAPRLQDAAAEGLQQTANVATGGKAALLRLAIDNAIRRVGLNEAEREAIVRLGIGSADELERIVRLAEESRRLGRRTPREVRAYILRTRNVLGAQTPEQLQIERLLLPAPASAEEEQ